MDTTMKTMKKIVIISILVFIATIIAAGDISLKKNEEITFSCSENYVIGKVIDDQFEFRLKDNSSSMTENFDWTAEISCNKEILKVLYYNCNNELILSKEAPGNSITIELEYSGEYCDHIKLFVIDEYGDIYPTEFYRTYA